MVLMITLFHQKIIYKLGQNYLIFTKNQGEKWIYMIFPIHKGYDS